MSLQVESQALFVKQNLFTQKASLASRLLETQNASAADAASRRPLKEDD